MAESAAETRRSIDCMRRRSPGFTTHYLLSLVLSTSRLGRLGMRERLGGDSRLMRERERRAWFFRALWFLPPLCRLHAPCLRLRPHHRSHRRPLRRRARSASRRRKPPSTTTDPHRFSQTPTTTTKGMTTTGRRTTRLTKTKMRSQRSPANLSRLTCSRSISRLLRLQRRRNNLG